MRVLSHRPAAISAVVFGLCLAGQAFAEELWDTACTEAERCTARLTVADTKSGRVFASLGVQVGKGGAEPWLIVFTPLGVALKPGFRAVLNGRTFEIPFEVCYPDGCRAVARITSKELDVWLAAETVSLQFIPFESDKTVAADAPLTGLREALKDVLPPAP